MLSCLPCVLTEFHKRGAGFPSNSFWVIIKLHEIQVITMNRLPEHIRPGICAFGGLADGFLPFQAPKGTTVELQLASVVMKAVQARKPGVETCLPCAGKLGDDADHSKAQVGQFNTATRKLPCTVFVLKSFLLDAAQNTLLRAARAVILFLTRSSGLPAQLVCLRLGQELKEVYFTGMMDAFAMNYCETN